jgi:hypothetical protein
MSSSSASSSARISKMTIKALKALRRPEEDDTIEDVIQRLIRFYLNKPDESKRRKKSKGELAS